MKPGLAPTLHGYRRSWLAGDAAAGAALLVIAVPEQLATSRLAGMPPITGFYAFIAGSVLFALLGTNPQVVGRRRLDDRAAVRGRCSGVFAASGSTRYGELVGILAVMAGVLVGARLAAATRLDRRAAVGADHRRLPGRASAS